MQQDAASACPGLPLVATQRQAQAQEMAGVGSPVSATESMHCDQVAADAGFSDPTATASFHEMMQDGLEDIFLSLY